MADADVSVDEFDWHESSSSRSKDDRDRQSDGAAGGPEYRPTEWRNEHSDGLKLITSRAVM